jgi:putative hydrolase of the HAD superfamily
MIEYIYFDLGNVLINFSHRRAAEQLAAVARCDAELAWRTVFDGRLQSELETGAIDSPAFCAAFRAATGTRAADADLMRAASDIFWLNASIVPLVGQLFTAGYPLGLLSNTCQAHWDFVWNRFQVLRSFFGERLLSFEYGVMKPDSRFFRAAIERAGCPPDRIFFVDDRPEHVAGAVGCGIDAVQFSNVAGLARQLHDRGVRMNY